MAMQYSQDMYKAAQGVTGGATKGTAPSPNLSYADTFRRMEQESIGGQWGYDNADMTPDEVREQQQWFKDNGYPTMTVDGYWGPQSRNLTGMGAGEAARAMNRYTSLNGYVGIDGSYYPVQSYMQQLIESGKFGKYNTPPGSYNNAGFSTDDIKALQKWLVNTKGADIAVDGYWGPATQRAAGMGAMDAMREYSNAMQSDNAANVAWIMQDLKAAGASNADMNKVLIGALQAGKINADEYTSLRQTFTTLNR